MAAARKLGLEELPAIELSGLSKAQKKALILADNKLALNSGWDLDLLKIELEELSGEDFNLSLLGFDLDELEKIMFNNIENDLPKEQELNAMYEIAVECKDENEQQMVFDMLTEKGYKCRVLTM